MTTGFQSLSHLIGKLIITPCAVGTEATIQDKEMDANLTAGLVMVDVGRAYLEEKTRELELRIEDISFECRLSVFEVEQARLLREIKEMVAQAFTDQASFKAQLAAIEAKYDETIDRLIEAESIIDQIYKNRPDVIP
jgi:hypothetical protein